MSGWIYVLQSIRDGRFYIGGTVNLEQRISHHKGGFTYSTKRFGKVKLVFSQKFPTLERARIIERKLKRLKRKDYIERIIHDGKIEMRV